MKIAITSTGKELGSALDGRFGRCSFFIIYDTDAGKVLEVMENSAAQTAGGAGIQAGQLIVNKGVQAVLTGNVGPNASGVLSNGGVQVYAGFSGTVQEAIDSFGSGGMSAASGPTVQSHAGMGAATPQPPANPPTNPPTNPPAGIPGGGMGMGGGGRAGGAGMGGGRGMGMGRGGGAGRGRGFGAGPPADCVCPSCGERVAHVPGTACRSMACPKCNTVMVRGD